MSESTKCDGCGNLGVVCNPESAKEVVVRPGCWYPKDYHGPSVIEMLNPQEALNKLESKAVDNGEVLDYSGLFHGGENE